MLRNKYTQAKTKYELIDKLTIYISNVLCYQYMYGTFSTFFSYLIKFWYCKKFSNEQVGRVYLALTSRLRRW